MQYTKVSPFDWYLLLDKPGSSRLLIRNVGEVKVSVSGPSVVEPYSFTKPLHELDGQLYLPISTVAPSEEARRAFAEDFSRAGVNLEQNLDLVITYEPESDDATS